jgi:hypothetical protein
MPNYLVAAISDYSEPSGAEQRTEVERNDRS